MPDKIIDVPNVGTVAFPDSMSDEAISAAIRGQQQDPYQQKTPAGKLGTGLYRSSIEPFIEGAKGMLTHPIDTEINAAKSLAQGTYNRFARPVQDIAGAAKQAGQGNWTGAAQTAASGLEHAATSLIPGLGVTQDIADTATGNITPGQPPNPAQADPARAGGMALGTAAMAALPAATSGVKSGAQAAGKFLTGAAEPDSMMFQALRPRSSQVDFSSSLERAMPEMKASERELGSQIGAQRPNSTPVQPIDDLLAVGKHAQQRVWNQYEQMLGPRASMTIDGDPVAIAVRKTLRGSLERQASMDPNVVKNVNAQAMAYMRPFSIADLEQRLQQANAELAAYESKFPAMKAAALKTNPDTAATVAESDAIRNLLYKTLDDAGDGAAARELKLRYGALSDVIQTAQRRKIILERQAPLNLTEQLSRVDAAKNIVMGAAKLPVSPLRGLAQMGSAAMEPAVARWLREVNSSGGLVRRAFANYTGTADPVQIPPAPLPQVGPPASPPWAGRPGGPTADTGMTGMVDQESARPGIVRLSPSQSGNPVPPWMRNQTNKALRRGIPPPPGSIEQ